MKRFIQKPPIEVKALSVPKALMIMLAILIRCEWSISSLTNSILFPWVLKVRSQLIEADLVIILQFC